MSEIDQIMSEKQEDVEVNPSQNQPQENQTMEIMSEKQEDVEVNPSQNQPQENQTMEEDGNRKQDSVKEESHEYANENSQQHENPEKEIHEHVKEVITEEGEENNEHVKEVITEEGEENNEHVKKVITEQVEENKEEAMEIERKIVDEGEKKTLDVDVANNENKSSEESKKENKSSEESEEKEKKNSKQKGKKNSKQKEKKRNRIMNMSNNYKKKQENVQAQSMKFRKSFRISEDFTIVLQRGDITKWSIDEQTDAIVNAANKRMIGGAGVDGAIHRAAGEELYWACKEFPFVEEDVRCPVGEARITGGFNLPARYVIHTVGPDYDFEDEPTSLLADAYRNSLNLAKEYKIKYVAFPAISCGIYGCPYEEGAEVSLTTVREFAQDLKEVHFILFEMEAWNAWLNKANELFAQEEPEIVN